MFDPHRSLAAPLAWLYWVLIIYASLHPFAPWVVPPNTLREYLILPQAYSNTFDKAINITGYVPMGFLCCTALLQENWRKASAIALALLVGSLTSYSMEVLQNFVPTRVPSRLDWWNNSLGTALGVALAYAAWRLSLIAQFRSLRERWLSRHSRYGIVLLLLWPIGLLFPPNVPWVEGQVVPRIILYVQTNFSGTIAQQWLPDTLWRDDWVSDVSPSAASLTLMMGLGLLAPTSLAYCICRRGWPRIVLMCLCLSTSIVIISLSTALNFGPDHAWAWYIPTVGPAFLLAAGLGLAWAWLPARWVSVLGLISLTSLTTWINGLNNNNPFYALSLSSWEQGNFIRFFGLAQWIGWCWPYVAILWLISRLTHNETPPLLEPATHKPA